MQFIYHENAGLNSLHVDLKTYEHLFKVRRMGVGELCVWRNLKDSFLYQYQMTQIGKKEAILDLVKTEEKVISASKELTLGWCVIDPKIIEKTLPMLNELGVASVGFVYADFSQKQYKLDYERMHRILINSSQQCGRSSLMRLEEYSSVKAYMQKHPQSYCLDFSPIALTSASTVSSILIGPEGGFSPKERVELEKASVVGLTCKTILRSETAVISVASKILA